MLKRVVYLIIGAIFLLSFHSHVLAQSPPIVGPTKYIRTTGSPNIYTDTFHSCNTEATYNLIVENGESGKDRISSASISLNGQEIVKESEFNQKIDKIERNIYLQQENALSIKLASGPEGLIKVSIYCVANCLEVNVTSPSDGGTINRTKAIIQGNIYNAFGEVGVILRSFSASGQVSGLAQVQGTNPETSSGQAFAGIIALQQGQNTIIAQATDACGYQVTDTVTINTDSIQEPIRLTAVPGSGIPDTVTGTFDATMEAEVFISNPVSNYSWDLNGDSIPDQEGSDLTKVTANYQYSGLYFPKVTVTDTQGNTYTETTIINVLSREEMDALLKGKWEGMRGELISENVDKAIGFFEEGSQESYRKQFNALKPVLNLIANEMGQIYLVKIEDDSAEYEIITTRNGITYSFHLLFVKDKDGLWKVKVF